jgi:hypothetical protein
MEVYLYGPIYRGSKLTYNSRKERGKIVEGIAIVVYEEQGTVILRDKENFVHCVEGKGMKKINSTQKGIHYKLIQK